MRNKKGYIKNYLEMLLNVIRYRSYMVYLVDILSLYIYAWNKLLLFLNETQPQGITYILFFNVCLIHSSKRRTKN